MMASEQKELRVIILYAAYSIKNFEFLVLSPFLLEYAVILKTVCYQFGG